MSLEHATIRDNSIRQNGKVNGVEHRELLSIGTENTPESLMMADYDFYIQEHGNDSYGDGRQKYEGVEGKSRLSEDALTYAGRRDRERTKERLLKIRTELLGEKTSGNKLPFENYNDDLLVELKKDATSDLAEALIELKKNLSLEFDQEKLLLLDEAELLIEIEKTISEFCETEEDVKRDLVADLYRLSAITTSKLPNLRRLKELLNSGKITEEREKQDINNSGYEIIEKISNATSSPSEIISRNDLIEQINETFEKVRLLKLEGEDTNETMGGSEGKYNISTMTYEEKVRLLKLAGLEEIMKKEGFGYFNTLQFRMNYEDSKLKITIYQEDKNIGNEVILDKNTLEYPLLKQLCYVVELYPRVKSDKNLTHYIKPADYVLLGEIAPE